VLCLEIIIDAPKRRVVEELCTMIVGFCNRVEVLRLVTQGLTTLQIAERLIISPRTADAHLRSIYSKLGVTSRSAATRSAIEHKLV